MTELRKRVSFIEQSPNAPFEIVDTRRWREKLKMHLNRNEASESLTLYHSLCLISGQILMSIQRR